MHRRNRIRVENLSRLLSYILGHRPDEFGLVPDREGFIGYKELLQAIHEEPGWGYVRLGDIREVLMGESRSLFDFDENRIRALERRWQIDVGSPEKMPPILYVAVRKRAHAHTMEKGLASERNVVLSADSEFAMRLGRRRDNKPVLLEVQTSAARQKNCSFLVFGNLYLTREIPPECLSGPPVEVEAVARKVERPNEESLIRKQEFMPGSFLLDAVRDPAPHRALRGKKGKGWKEEARKMRKRRSR
ncbi:MAG: hypothetical protein C4576_35515 [Desulfobacteraceae bacterium]|nr:MAG: hypothetical protein C4576_35515 [Desulfobacteraceae bacterium]